MLLLLLLLLTSAFAAIVPIAGGAPAFSLPISSDFIFDLFRVVAVVVFFLAFFFG